MSAPKRNDFDLLRAATLGDSLTIERLLNTKADPKLRDMHGMSPLMRAALSGSRRCVELLLPSSEVDAVDHSGVSALFHAARSGQWKCAAALAAHSEPRSRGTSLRDKFGQTALMIAAMFGSEAGAKLLLPYSDALERDSNGNRASGIAQAAGHSILAQWLHSEEERAEISAAVASPEAFAPINAERPTRRL